VYFINNLLEYAFKKVNFKDIKKFIKVTSKIEIKYAISFEKSKKLIKMNVNQILIEYVKSQEKRNLKNLYILKFIIIYIIIIINFYLTKV